MIPQAPSRVFSRRQRLALMTIASLSVLGGITIGLIVHGSLSAAVSRLISTGQIIPRPPYFSRPLVYQTTNIGAPALGTSSWTEAIPPHNAVQRLTGRFTVPEGMQPASQGQAALDLWVGIGDYPPILQSGVSMEVAAETGTRQRVRIPAYAWTTNYNGGSFANMLTGNSFTLRPGDQVQVSLTFPPVVWTPSLAGYWMASTIVIRRDGRLLRVDHGRLYAPPWFHARLIAIAVEAPGFGAFVYPAGSWAVPVTWDIQLAHPWPSIGWARAHQAQIISTGHILGGPLTNISRTHIVFSPTGERGSGGVSYAAPAG